MANLLLKLETARDFVERATAACGFTAEEDAVTADVPLTADLYGLQPHGVHRLIRHADAIREGFIDPKAAAEAVFETPLSAVWDAPKALEEMRGIAAGLGIEANF